MTGPNMGRVTAERPKLAIPLQPKSRECLAFILPHLHQSFGVDFFQNR